MPVKEWIGNPRSLDGKQSLCKTWNDRFLLHMIGLLRTACHQLIPWTSKMHWLIENDTIFGFSKVKSSFFVLINPSTSILKISIAIELNKKTFSNEYYGSQLPSFYAPTGREWEDWEGNISRVVLFAFSSV